MSRMTRLLQEKFHELGGTSPGRERDMYPAIKEILCKVFGHESARVHTDVRVVSGGVPDVYVDVLQANGLLLHRWIVVEAKDERGVFRDPLYRDQIFEQKRSYVGIDTEWFVFVDPQTWVLRRLAMGRTQGEDRVIPLPADPQEFLDAAEGLSRNAAQEQAFLREFRLGREDWLSCLDLGRPENKQLFLETMQKAYRLLEQGCRAALQDVKVVMSKIDGGACEAERIWGRRPDFQYSPFELVGIPLYIHDRKQVKKYRELTKYFWHLYSSAPRIFRLAVSLGKRLAEAENDEERDRVWEELVFYTVLSLLSRILMLRFLEDHGFFGEGKKYLCNGGIRAFDEMRRYFELKYPHLLKQACEFGAAIYPPIFSDGEFDWVFDCPAEEFSAKLERVLFHLSFFDFRTVREDVLSGVYQNVQRAIRPRIIKDLGIVFTPPPVARYLVKKCREILGREDCAVLDPACGTGTFLLEWLEDTLGEAIRRGVVSYETVCKALEKIAGNDINPVASLVAQMQLLWRLLPYADEIKRRGFPELRVSTADALKVRNLFTVNSEWDLIEMDRYSAVLGNPPYIRPEVWQRALGREEVAFYSPVSARSNSRTLFVYKAFQQWLEDGGVLAFVLPLSVFDSEEGEELRRLFAPESGQWRIVEIVDMEEVARYVFPQVSVNPVLFVAKKEAPQPTDTVTLRVVHEDAVVLEGQELRDLDPGRFETAVMPYPEIFSLDGDNRVLTRVNPVRRRLVEKIASFPVWRDIAKKYWVRYEGSRIVEASLTGPSGPGRWEERRMLGMGLAFRRKKVHRPGGLPVYKGEHILACQFLSEEPAEREVDVQKADDPAFWRFPEILPEKGFAFQRISLNLTACSFNPREAAFMNTATLFFPEDRLRDIPFDFLVISGLYRWYFAVALRTGVVEEAWGDVYPRTVGCLPWSEDLLPAAFRLQQLRCDYLDACRYLNQDLLGQLYGDGVRLETLEERALRLRHIEIRWPGAERVGEAGWHRYYFGSLFDFFEINDQETYELLCMVLPLLGLTTAADRAKILSVRLPATSEGVELWKRIYGGRERKQWEEKKCRVLQELDEITVSAFRLEPEEAALIKADLETDPLFRRLRPAEPFTARRLRGFWGGLDRADRYRKN
ncbi:MAG: Eco57I restriction-modification methylase domain-containing protein [Moorellales bacterium]